MNYNDIFKFSVVFRISKKYNTINSMIKILTFVTYSLDCEKFLLAQIFILILEEEFAEVKYKLCLLIL